MDDVPIDGSPDAWLEHAFRRSWGRVIATAFRINGDLGLAEEAAAAAFEDAATSWRADGVPRSVEAWLVTAARRRAIDQVRRVATARKHVAALAADDSAGPDDTDPELDELRFLALCADPSQPVPTQVIMLLRFGCGLPTDALAAMHHVPAATMAARLTRGKQRLQAAIRAGSTLDTAIEPLLPVIIRAVYLIFTAGTNPATGDQHTASDRVLHADFLSTVLLRRFPGTDPTALRILIMLADDPSEAALYAALRLTPGITEVTALSCQSAIAIEHALARSGRERHWLRIAELHDALLTLDPNPTFAVGRAVAIGHAFGPAVGLADLDDLGRRDDLRGYRYLHAARADCLQRLGRDTEAAAAWRRAAELSSNSAQRRYFVDRASQ